MAHITKTLIYKSLVVIAIVFLLWMDVISMIYDYFSISDDNRIEEAVEDIINHKTGIEVDFTP